MTAARQRLIHSSTPLTMTFTALATALEGLLGQPQDVRPAHNLIFSSMIIGEIKGKRRSGAFGRLDLERAAVSGYNAFHDGQPQAGAA
jgi:hypothetical protein